MSQKQERCRAVRIRAEADGEDLAGGGSVMGREDRVGRRGRGEAASKEAAEQGKGPRVAAASRAAAGAVGAGAAAAQPARSWASSSSRSTGVAGLVLPASTQVPHRRRDRQAAARTCSCRSWAAVVGATVVQGVTSFALTQTLSKAAQRLIADLRRQVQAHVGRLPVAFYDANKTGNLVSRIMSDVEGRAEPHRHRARGVRWAACSPRPSPSSSCCASARP